MADELNLEPSLTRKSVDNFGWSALSVASVSGSHFVIGILLARMLEPRDFGIVAFAMVFVAITGRITQFGVAPAIVQSKRLNRYHLRSGFTITVLLALAGYCVLFILAPGVTSGVRTDVLRVAGLGLIVSSMGVVAQSLLQRELRFKRLFIVELSSGLIGYGFVSITLALLGYGPWSLVLGNLSHLLLKNAAYVVVARPPLAPSLKRVESKELVSYGFGLSLGTFANALARSGHLFVVGRFLGDAILGVYQRAFSLVMFPISSWNAASAYVLFPTLAKVQDEQGRLSRGFLMSVSLTSFFLFPVLAAVALCAPEIVIGLLTEKWRDAIPVLRAFCIFGVFASIYPLVDALGRACGRVYLKSMIHIVYAVVSICLCYAAVRYGLLYVVGAMAVSVFITYSLMGVLAAKILHASFGRFLWAQASGACSALVVACLCYPVTRFGRQAGMPDLGLLSIQVLTCGIGLGVAFFCLPAPLVGPIRKIVGDRLGCDLTRGFRRILFDRASCG